MNRLLPALLVAATLSTSAFAKPHVVAKVCTPPFPYSCSTVRWAVAKFPRSWLEAEGKRRGMNACHKAFAIACINGAP
jgi:hypothetical protein